MLCKFVQRENIYVCENCGFQMHKPVKRNCVGTVSGKIISGATSVSSAVKDVVTGNLVTGEEKARRLDICKQCEHFDNKRCKLCGCFLNFKTRVANAHCPIGKW